MKSWWGKPAAVVVGISVFGVVALAIAAVLVIDAWTGRGKWAAAADLVVPGVVGLAGVAVAVASMAAASEASRLAAKASQRELDMTFRRDHEERQRLERDRRSAAAIPVIEWAQAYADATAGNVGDRSELEAQGYRFAATLQAVTGGKPAKAATEAFIEELLKFRRTGPESAHIKNLRMKGGRQMLEDFQAAMAGWVDNAILGGEMLDEYTARISA